MICSSRSRLFGTLFTAFALCASAPAALADGIDTTINDLPFKIIGTQIMDLTADGLTISNTTNTALAANLIVTQGMVAADNGYSRRYNPSPNWSGCFGSDCVSGGLSSYYGVYGNGTQYGVYGQGYSGAAGVTGASDTGWGGSFSGGNGVYAYTTNGYGVYAQSTASVGVYGQGPEVGVYGQSGAGWAGWFNAAGGTGGVYITNNRNNAQLCLNGQCVASIPPAEGGFYEITSGCISNGCYHSNPKTGGCSCPSGYTGQYVFDAFINCNYELYWCEPN
jgi:hypothetical protein